jgi:hypothetical protein
VGKQTEPFVDPLRDFLLAEVGDIEVEVVSAPFGELGGGRGSVEIEVDGDKVATVVDGVVSEVDGGFELVIVLVVVLSVDNDGGNVVEGRCGVKQGDELVVWLKAVVDIVAHGDDGRDAVGVRGVELWVINVDDGCEREGGGDERFLGVCFLHVGGSNCAVRLR